MSTVRFMDFAKKKVGVLDAEMAYLEVGAGRPIVFLHGNPTSSYLWRDVIPHLSAMGRCIAPDLIGMGDSDKVGGDYRFVDHRRYLDALLDQLGVAEDVILVLHDWGGALGFDWANRHRDSAVGLVFGETIVGPLPSWDQWPESSRSLFQAIRSEAGERIILEKNAFVERILPASVLKPMSEEVLEEYRRPFNEPGESRRPTLTWPRQIPVAGDPADVTEIVAGYQAWLRESEIPKLFIEVEPGFLTPLMRPECMSWPNLRTVTVPGVHFFQEDSADQTGQAIVSWLASL